MKKQKASYVNYLEELMNDKKITKKEFINNIYDVYGFLEKLVEKKVITKKEFDDRILLPFKFGAVSMAKKTNAYLVPFGISGDYKFRSKNLIVRIGKPIKANEDLEKANAELRKEIIKLMKENSEK